ncbi:MAG: hypothetical protein KatS3mg119_0975 [Rhodothalassiaceae bacterium]|nr:MAG: hypothetical protein KatS3mg119_0975 [Rhodothalassiaceae bacterium]
MGRIKRARMHVTVGAALFVGLVLGAPHARPADVSDHGRAFDVREAALYRCVIELGEALHGESVAADSDGRISKSEPDGQAYSGVTSCRIFQSDLPASSDVASLAQTMRREVDLYWQKLQGMSPAQRRACAAVWRQTWNRALEAVSAGVHGKGFPALGQGPIPRGLSAVQEELFVRASFDRAATRIFETDDARRSMMRQKDGFDISSGCFGTLDLAVTRAENVVFFMEKKLDSMFRHGNIPASLFTEFWVIIQHADLACGFQKQGLQLLKTWGPRQNFPDRLITSLETRLSAPGRWWCEGGK